MNRHTFVAALLLGLLVPLLIGTSTATAQIPAERATYTPTWHQVHFHMNAYRRTGHEAIHSGGCSGSWHDDRGQCWGYGERHSHSYPFSSYLVWKWHRHPTLCPDVPGGRDPAVWKHEVWLKAAHDGSGEDSVLCGWVDHGWHTMIVTGGEMRFDPEPRTRPIHATGGWIGHREQQGGPLFVHLSDAGSGYVFGLRGWLRY